MKVLAAVLVGLLVVLVGWLAFFQKSPRSEAELFALVAPPDADLFIALPSLAETSRAVSGGGLGSLARDKRLEESLSALAAVLVQTELVQSAIPILERLRPAAFWVAVRFSGGEQPEWIVALRPGGSAEGIDEGLRKVLESGDRTVPLQAVEVEGWKGWQRAATAPEEEGVWAVRSGSWAAASNSRRWLKDTRLRLRGIEEGGLAGDQAFRSAVRYLPKNPVLMVFLRTGALARGIEDFAGSLTSAPPLPPQIERLKNWRVWAYAVVLDKETKETSILLGEPPRAEPLTGIAAAMAPADAVAVWEGEFSLPSLLEWVRYGESLDRDVVQNWEILEGILSQLGIGPSAGVTVWWGAQSLLPSVVFSSSVRDPETLRTALNTVGLLLGGRAQWQNSDGVTALAFPAADGLPMLAPVLALREESFFAALAPGDLSLAWETMAGGQGLTGAARWSSYSKFWNEAQGTRMWVDVPLGLRRLVKSAQGLTALATLLSPSQSGHLRMLNSLDADALAGHFSPYIARQRVLAGAGIVNESSSAITPVTLLLGFAAGMRDGFADLRRFAAGSGP